MSKELEALEAFNYIKRFTYFQDGCYKDKLDAIETALKENERLRTSYLENLLNEESKEYIRKKLKALEIIKEKRVDVELLMKTENAKDYNKYSKNVNQSHNLGQRQYDFLKEVLL